MRFDAVSRVGLIGDAAAHHQQVRVLALGERPRRDCARPTAELIGLVVVSGAASILGAAICTGMSCPFHRNPRKMWVTQSSAARAAARSPIWGVPVEQFSHATYADRATMPGLC